MMAEDYHISNATKLVQNKKEVVVRGDDDIHDGDSTRDESKHSCCGRTRMNINTEIEEEAKRLFS